MTAAERLERRYRRLIAMYPRKFRQANEEEMLTVLMSGARDGQRWPRLAEVVNLGRYATPSRLREGPPPEGLARRHPRGVMTIRILLFIWLLVLTVGFTLHTPWGLAFLLAEALNVYLFLRTYMWQRAGGGPADPPSTLSRSR